MNGHTRLLGVVLAAGFFLAAPEMPRSAAAGNADLLRSWAVRHQAWSERFARQLLEESRTPGKPAVASGREPARLEGETARQALDAAFAPRSPGVRLAYADLPVPVQAQARHAVPAAAVKPAVEPPAAPAPVAPVVPDEPSLWQKIRHFFGS